MRKRAKVAKAKNEMDKENIKAMANAMRVQILTILNERANSATGIAKELGVDFAEVSYEMEVLRKIGRIEVVQEVKRRGAVEVFYRATSRAQLDELEWPVVPDPVKGDMRASLLQTLMDDAIAAISEGTYDSLESAHMSWSPLIVDKQGWDKLVEILRRGLEDALAVHRESAERLIAEDAEGISCTVSILGYPSAQEQRKVGPPIDAQQLVDLTTGERPKPKRARKKKTGPKKTKATAKGQAGKAAPKKKRKNADK
ncbi:MAG TPA: winged helix-turn-helix domain-containing protein [Solirubrobacterales bacterium]